MPEYPITCRCGQGFTARSPLAKWHSDVCRKRHQRRGLVGRVRARSQTPAAAPDGRPSDLERVVRSALVEAGRLESFAGQLALTLAARLAGPDEAGASALSKELRAVMDQALGQGAVAVDPAETDEVTQARSARERKRLGLAPEDR